MHRTHFFAFALLALTPACGSPAEELDCSGVYVCEFPDGPIAGRAVRDGSACNVGGMLLRDDGQMEVKGEVLASWVSTRAGFDVCAEEVCVSCVAQASMMAGDPSPSAGDPSPSGGAGAAENGQR